MADNKNEKAREALFEALDDVHSVMLGSDTVSDYMQPMAPLFDEDDDSTYIWFFTNSATQMATSAVIPIEAKICLMSRDDGVYACINGTLATRKNPAIIKKFWSPIVGAWFRGGKEDPELTTLCFTPRSAAVWVNEANMVRFGFEIAKANLMETTPDLGFHLTVNF